MKFYLMARGSLGTSSTYTPPTLGKERGCRSLWAVQRSYERGETRYYEYLADKFKLIIDWDDPEMAARLKSMFRI